MEESFWKRLWTCRQTDYCIIISAPTFRMRAVPDEGITVLVTRRYEECGRDGVIFAWRVYVT